MAHIEEGRTVRVRREPQNVRRQVPVVHRLQRAVICVPCDLINR
jgi:hypothetical protein